MSPCDIAFSMSILLFLPFTSVSLAQYYQPEIVHDVDLFSDDTILLTDGGPYTGPGGGIYRINRDGNVLWTFTADLAWAHNADRQPDGSIIISDTHHDRVIIIDEAGNILWNSDDVPLSDGSTFNYPNDANLLSGGNRLVTDRDNHRVVEFDSSGTVVWQFGETGVPGTGPSHLNGPHNADRLPNGNTIIADSNNNRIVEVSPSGAIVWSYTGGLDWPRDADRLSNGNTLINDSQNYRIIEITFSGSVVWQYDVPELSYDADRLESGTTLISLQSGIREVDVTGETVWSYPVLYETEIVQGYFVEAQNGNQLWVKIIQPRSDLYPGEIFPAVVNVPGGLGAGETMNGQIANRGFVDIHFNAEGRGILHPSEGEENHNGFLHQDDLKAIIDYALNLVNVDPDNVGVVTRSYGITMGAGCLGRYPGLGIKYLIDVEGPSDSFVTSFEPWSLDEDPSNNRLDQGYAMFGHWSIYRDPSPENIAWWSEREASYYIGDVSCRYLRIQADWDHAQPPNESWPGFDYPPLWYQNKHAVDLCNIATLGLSPWTRINGPEQDNQISVRYDRLNPPAYYNGDFQSHPGELTQLILEMASMPPVTCIHYDYMEITGNNPSTTPTSRAPCLCGQSMNRRIH